MFPGTQTDLSIAYPYAYFPGEGTTIKSDFAELHQSSIIRPFEEKEFLPYLLHYRSLRICILAEYQSSIFNISE